MKRGGNENNVAKDFFLFFLWIMIEISLNNKETVQPTKAAKRTKTQGKNQQQSRPQASKTL